MVIQAVLFDTFGTVVDWRSGVVRDVVAFAGRHGLSLDAERFATDWRGLYQPAMENVRSGRREFVQLDQLHLENLRLVLEAHAVPRSWISDAEINWLNGAWQRLDPWPDSVPALTSLKEHLIVGALSNGNVSLLVRLSKHAGLPWDVVAGSDLSRAYKPDPRAYRFAAELLDLAPEEVMLCAAHNSDLAAARAVGFRTAFVPRRTEHSGHQTQDLAPEQDWDVVVEDLRELPSRLAAELRSPVPSSSSG
jgi:2-haloacid dehalogenase